MKLGTEIQRENCANATSIEANDSKRANSAEDKLRRIAQLGQEWNSDPLPGSAGMHRKRWERLAEIALDYFA
jgi:hypothetical protein